MPLLVLAWRPRFSLRTLLRMAALLAILFTAYSHRDWFWPVRRGAAHAHTAGVASDQQSGVARLTISAALDVHLGIVREDGNQRILLEELPIGGSRNLIGGNQVLTVRVRIEGNDLVASCNPGPTLRIPLDNQLSFPVLLDTLGGRSNSYFGVGTSGNAVQFYVRSEGGNSGDPTLEVYLRCERHAQ